MTKKLILAAILACCSICSLAQLPPANACPTGQDDVLSWMLPNDMRYHVEGANLKVFAAEKPDKMYFMKAAQGWPLDEKLYDAQFIYDYITENGALGWQSPANVKEYVTPLKLSTRCIPVGVVGQRLSSVTNTDTRFVKKISCQITGQSSLGTSVNQVWNNGLVDFGGSLGLLDTRVLVYRYSCNPFFSNCKYKEELYLARPYGWIEWKYYVLESGQYVLKNDTKANELRFGSTSPVQPCGDAPIQ